MCTYLRNAHNNESGCGQKFHVHYVSTPPLATSQNFWISAWYVFFFLIAINLRIVVKSLWTLCAVPSSILAPKFCLQPKKISAPLNGVCWSHGLNQYEIWRLGIHNNHLKHLALDSFECFLILSMVVAPITAGTLAPNTGVLGIISSSPLILIRLKLTFTISESELARAL